MVESGSLPAGDGTLFPLDRANRIRDARRHFDLPGLCDNARPYVARRMGSTCPTR